MKKHIDFSVFILAGIVLIVAASIAASVLALNRDYMGTGFEDGRAITALFIIEHEGKPLGSYLLLYNQSTRQAAAFEVPGKLGLILRQIGRVDRIDTVYKTGRIAPYTEEVEKLFDIKVNYNFVINMHNLGKIVDLLEGVNVFIPGDIRMPDNEDAVLFSSGFTKLDGYKTFEYLCYQNPDYDIETPEQRNQRFFTGFLNRIGEKKDYLKSPEVIRLFKNYAETNMGGRVLPLFFDELNYIDTDRFSITSIGGNIREVSGQQLLFPYYDGSLIKEIARQTLSSLARINGGAGGNRVFTVEVLNGTEVAGLAGRTADLIRGFGYDVINIGNASGNDYEFTEIIDRSNFSAEAERFAGIINCKRVVPAHDNGKFEGNGAAVTLENYEYKADFTLIIGKDFNGRHTQS
ncbi:MAG: LCP family protein [Spirochaetaceae bacterium]|nr:LCP family protein [Spirochaetaceae bacterium]